MESESATRACEDGRWGQAYAYLYALYTYRQDSEGVLVLRTAHWSPVDHPECIALRALKPVADFCWPALGLRHAVALAWHV
jgi:hypothetical protein